jgi:hypothetical protein
VKVYGSPQKVLADVERALASSRPTFHHQPGGKGPLDEVVKILYGGRHYFWIGIYLVAGRQVVRFAVRCRLATRSNSARATSEPRARRAFRR